MKLALALLLSLVLAAPAAAADKVVWTADGGPIDFDSYRNRVAWTVGDDDAMDLWTLEHGVATQVAVKPISTGMDVTAGPKGQPVAVYPRCADDRCTFYLYDFAAGREQRLMGAPKDDYANWRFWRDRFALIRHHRFVVVGLDGSTHDVGRARKLENTDIDFNGEALIYVNDETYDDEDRTVYDLAYFPVSGQGKHLKHLAYGASGERWLLDARTDARYAYTTEIGGEFGGPNRLWRVDEKTGKQEYAGLPAKVRRAIHIGDRQALASRCYDEEEDGRDDCELVLTDVRYR